jgi:hypothetical protein
MSVACVVKVLIKPRARHSFINAKDADRHPQSYIAASQNLPIAVNRGLLAGNRAKIAL